MKVIVLNWGGLCGMYRPEIPFISHYNPSSDVRLSAEESADAIVPDHREGLNIKRFRDATFRFDMLKAANFRHGSLP